MNRRAIVASVVFLYFSVGWAKKEVVYFGGGGEPAGEATIFDEAYSSFSLFRSPDWQVRSYFDGGHKKSEALAQKMFQGRNKSMTHKNVNAEIESLMTRINQGDLKAGDQVLLTIATHGVSHEPPEKTHKVTTIDQDFSMDSLIKLRNLAEKKGVSLAIADFSCHSGNSLKLGTDKTCVISASGEGIAYNKSGAFLGYYFQKGSNLEEAYLKGRSDKDAVVPAAPQITTEAGRKAYELTKTLSEAMQEKSVINLEATPKDDCYGKNSQPFNKLAMHVAEIERNTDVVEYLMIRFGLRKSAAEEALRKLHTATKKYYEKRANIVKAHKKMSAEDKEHCLSINSTQQVCGKMNILEHSLKYFQAKKAAGPLSKIEAEQLAAYEKFSKTPAYKNWLAVNKEFAKQPELYGESMKVAAAEREVYGMLYEHFSKKARKPNPCRSFVL